MSDEHVDRLQTLEIFKESNVYTYGSKMLNETDIKESNIYIDWLEKSITNEYFNYYEYSDFKNIELIGIGSCGSVARANWKGGAIRFALKSFNNDKMTLKEVVNEVRILQVF